MRGRSIIYLHTVGAFRILPMYKLDPDGPIIEVLAWRLTPSYRPDRTGD